MRGIRIVSLGVALALCAVGLGNAAGRHTLRLSVNVLDEDPPVAAAFQGAHHGDGQGNGPSALSTPSVSADGSLVVFDSEATNLALPHDTDGTPVADTNGVADIFLHDTRTRLNRRITTSITGGEANGPSRNPVISRDGRFVAFESDADNLVTGDLNEASDVFLRDLVTDTTVLVSRAPEGGAGNAASRRPSIAGFETAIVAFESDATNLVPGDTNDATDVFVASGVVGLQPRMTLVSRGATGPANGPSGTPSLSPSGLALAFASRATNLVSGDTNAVEDVFLVLPTLSGRPQLLSRAGSVQGNGGSRAPSMSGFPLIAFESDATNLASDDLNGTTDVFALQGAPGTPMLVSRGMNGSAKGTSRAPAVSEGGRIAFVSDAFDLVPSLGIAEQNVYLADVAAGKIESVSSGDGPSDGPSHAPAISGDGLFIAYASDASNLVMDDTNGARDLFSRIDETHCANGAVEDGPASSGIHGSEPGLGPVESPAHSVSCQIAAAGL